MRKHLNLRANIALGLIFAFLVNTFWLLPIAQAQEFILPAPGQMVALSPAFSPVVLKGIKLDPKNPFRFHFYVDTGDVYTFPKKSMSSPNDLIGSSYRTLAEARDPQQEQLKLESAKLIKYFLASLTIPEKDLWVNLSPYEKDRIIPQEFGKTEMGRDLLAQDYMLKQITASMIYPESKLGKEFWNKVYAQAQAQYRTTNIPINTFNKVWIVPEKAVVYENKGVAFILESHLKVMLEEDYLSMQKHNVPPLSYKEGVRGSSKNLNTMASQIIRQIVIPALTQEVNEGKNFSQLRQVFYSLILAAWYKKKIMHSIINKIYSDQNKITGVGYDKSLSSLDTNSTMSSPNDLIGDPEHIYQQYLKAFKKGVYNYIKEEADPLTNGAVSRKYFSGGWVGSVTKILCLKNQAQLTPKDSAQLNRTSEIEVIGDLAMITNNSNPRSRDQIQAAYLETSYEWFNQHVVIDEEDKIANMQNDILDKSLLIKEDRIDDVLSSETLLYRDLISTGVSVISWRIGNSNNINIGIERNGFKMPFILLEVPHNRLQGVYPLVPSQFMDDFFDLLDQRNKTPKFLEVARKYIKTLKKDSKTSLFDFLIHQENTFKRIQNATVQIKTNTDGLVGSGVIFRDEKNELYVATARHVIDGVNENLKEAEERIRGEEFTVILSNGQEVIPQEVAFDWANDFRDELAHDIAILKLPHKTSEIIGDIIAPLELSQESINETRPVAFCGIPSKTVNRKMVTHETLSLISSSVSTYHSRNIYIIPLELFKGMSGGPLIDQTTGKLIGVVTGALEHKRTSAAGINLQVFRKLMKKSHLTLSARLHEINAEFPATPDATSIMTETGEMNSNAGNKPAVGTPLELGAMLITDPHTGSTAVRVDESPETKGLLSRLAPSLEARRRQRLYELRGLLEDMAREAQGGIIEQSVLDRHHKQYIFLLSDLREIMISLSIVGRNFENFFHYTKKESAFCSMCFTVSMLAVQVWRQWGLNAKLQNIFETDITQTAQTDQHHIPVHQYIDIDSMAVDLTAGQYTDNDPQKIVAIKDKNYRPVLINLIKESVAAGNHIIANDAVRYLRDKVADYQRRREILLRGVRDGAIRMFVDSFTEAAYDRVWERLAEVLKLQKLLNDISWVKKVSKAWGHFQRDIMYRQSSCNLVVAEFLERLDKKVEFRDSHRVISDFDTSDNILHISVHVFIITFFENDVWLIDPTYQQVVPLLKQNPQKKNLIVRLKDIDRIANDLEIPGGSNLWITGLKQNLELLGRIRKIPGYSDFGGDESKAMLVVTKHKMGSSWNYYKKLKGGIDMNPAQINMQVRAGKNSVTGSLIKTFGNDKDDFQFDSNVIEIDAAQISGIIFTIRTMIPVTNLLMELGLKG